MRTWTRITRWVPPISVRLLLAGLVVCLCAGGWFASAEAGVRYRGETIFGARDLDEWLGVDPVLPPSAEDLAARLPGLLGRYVAEGYVDARVRLLAEGEDLVVEVEPGVRVRVQARPVSGAPREHAESLDRALDFEPGQSLSEREIRDDLERAVRYLTERGHPYAEASARDFVREAGDVSWRLHLESGEGVQVDSLHIEGMTLTRQSTAERIANFRPGREFREQDLAALGSRLRRSGLFSAVGEVTLKVDPTDGSGVFHVPVREAPSTQLYGVIGVGGTRQELNGLLDVQLDNLFGTARAFRARWEGRGEGRVYYEIGYREPWVLGLPLSLEGQFRQDQEDSVFTRTDWLLDAAFDVTDQISLRIGWQSEETSSLTGFVTRSERNSSRVGFRWDTGPGVDGRRDAFLDVLTTRGAQRELQFDGERVRRDVTTLEVRGETELALGRRNGLFFRYRGYLRDAPGEPLRAENLYPVGGAQSLRGYEERRFRTGFGSVLTTEMRWYVGREGARVFLFVDGAWMDPERSLGTGTDPWRYGAGFGLRVPSRVGLMGVDFAASDETRSVQEVRVHISITGRY